VTTKAFNKNSVNIVYRAKGDGTVTQQVTMMWTALEASL